MPKKKAFHANQGTVWFLAILILSALGATYTSYSFELTMIVAICGAIVAILNVTRIEESKYIMAVTALVVIVTSWKLLGITTNNMLGIFMSNLVVGFGVAGFILALALIAKIGLYR